MKIKTRKNIFETNSSSIHSICIYNDKEEKYPDKVVLETDDYLSDARTTQEKLNYFYTLCCYWDKENPVLYPFLEKSAVYQFKKYLESKGIEVEFKKEEPGLWGCGDYELFFEEVFKDNKFNEELLDNFIFNPLSFTITRDNNYREDPVPGTTPNYIQFNFDE